MKKEVEEALQDESGKKLLEHRADVLAMLQSPAFQIWLDWAKAVSAGNKMTAIYGQTPAEREEARLTAIAWEKFQGIPLLLGTILEEGSGDTAPSNP